MKVDFRVRFSPRERVSQRGRDELRRKVYLRQELVRGWLSEII